MDELIVLGSSSGVPTGRRFSSAYALTAAGKSFLIDCGAPASTLLYRYGLDPFDIEAVFISHWHLDHIAGLGLFLLQNRQRPGKLSVYGPKGTMGKIRNMLSESFLTFDKFESFLNITNIKPGKKYKSGLISVKYFKTEHLEQAKYKANFGPKAVACGMIISGPGWRVVYSGDVRSPSELSAHIGRCDLLIHEMSHVRPEEVAEFAEAAKIPWVLVSHIALEYDRHPEKIIRAFSGRYSGRLTIAEDGTRLNLPVHGS
jgi:ribonuclease Z